MFGYVVAFFGGVILTTLLAAVLYRRALKHVNNRMESLKKEAMSEGYQKRMNEDKENRESSDNVQYEEDGCRAIGKRVIVIGNEWEELIVGDVIGFHFFKMGGRVPIVRDCLTGEESMTMGLLVPYHIDMLRAMVKLNPFERYGLAISSRMYHASQYIFDKRKTYNEDGSPDTEGRFLGVDEEANKAALIQSLRAGGFDV